MNWHTFLRRHSELLLVLTVLLVISAVFHWIPYKIAFLNFFFVPVLAAGYLMGARRAILSGVMCVLLVLIYYFYIWTKGDLDAGLEWTTLTTVHAGRWDTLLNIALWGGFLILIGAAFGFIQEKVLASDNRARELDTTLEESTKRLQRQADELKEKGLKIEQLKQNLEDFGWMLVERDFTSFQTEQLKKKLEETLDSAMDSNVARLLIQDKLREEKRNLSVLFCDLEGFTNYAHSRNPEVVLEDLNHFYQVMEGVIESYHGHIDKYLGDGIMCEFGAPVDYEQHSLQAVVAGLMMQKEFAKGDFPWRLRVGMASGESIVGLMGSRRRHYSVIGEVSNLAKRLEELCEGSSIYLDEATDEAVRHLVETERVRKRGARRAEDCKIAEQIAEMKRELEGNRQDADLLFTIGQLHFSIREASQAVAYFRQAMELKPDDNAIKLAYADASVKLDEYEKIAIRGLEKKQAVFRAVGLVNPLKNRERFPPCFHDRYHHVQGLMEIPDEEVVPTEVVDGSVGHSLCVAVLSYALGDQLGLPEELKRPLLVAGRLQDLGKCIVGHHILNRRGVLSEQERKDLERHVDESVAIARRMGYEDPRVIEIIANHHELLSGEGYPRRVTGDDIPLGARITCVADIYCALTERRPYRRAWDSRVALSEIHKGSAAGRLDPRVVDALNRLMVPA
jgi:putative nucleotidyltransferase with HDIG domain